LGKSGACYTERMRIFFPFFGLYTPFLKYYRRAKFWMGALPPPRDMAKNWFAAKRILGRYTL